MFKTVENGGADRRMLKDIIRRKSGIHTRDIRLATYPHTSSEIIVEGVLTDKRKVRIFDILGKIKEPGIIHHMTIRLLIKGGPLRIVHAEAEMHHVPMAECRSTINILEKVIGIEVKSGFYFYNRYRIKFPGLQPCYIKIIWD